MPCPYTPSPSALALLGHFEGCRLLAYLPTPHDRPTIGWGSTQHADGRPVRLGERWSQAEANAHRDRDVAAFGASVAQLIGDAPTIQSQFDALVVLAYNIGVSGLAGSTLLRLHKAGDFAGAAAAFAAWRFQAGRPLPGLVRRRAAEAALYRGEA